MKTKKKKKQNHLKNGNALGPTKKIVVLALDKVGDETPLTKKKVNESRVLRTISDVIIKWCLMVLFNSPPRLLYVMRCDCMVQWTTAIVSLNYENNLDKSFGGEVVARCYYKLEKDSSLFKHKLKHIRGGRGHTFQEFPWHPHVLSLGLYHT
ncbi:unnamed protein product [Lactuca virosa]|uniref:Uncharacterized protein n=1 Tax=Lactuca virosa TaxID=75947 RepID=A0AAU9LND6_9ASTR|nr:unnamed protein product [Lactuca virosa]